MKKAQARAQLARLASSRGLSVKFTLGNKVERVTVLNSSHKPVATGQLKLTATGDYSANDLISIKASLAQVKAAGTKPNKRVSEILSGKNASRRTVRKGNKLNCAEDVDYEGDDANFVDDAEGVVQDQDGNEIVVEGMLIVQDPDTAEISLFIPDDTDDTVPESVEVIGKVVPTAEEAVLDSSRRKMNSSNRRKMNCSKSFTKMTIPELEALSDDWGYEPGELTELAEDGEQTLGAKFLGLAGPDDEYFVFKTEDGSVKAYEMGAGAWGDVMDLDSSRRKMNCSDDVEDPAGDSVVAVVDENGESVVVNDILVVQDDKSSEINVFVPEDGAELPDGVTVIGEVRPSDDTSALDSSRRILKRGTRLNAAKAKPARKKVKTNCSTSEKLSAADQEKILGLFSKAGVKVTSSFDGTDTHDGVAYNLFCVETENRSVPVRGSFQSDLHELESQDIGYDVEVGPNGFYSRTYQFYYYEDEPTSENRCWHARPRV